LDLTWAGPDCLKTVAHEFIECVATFRSIVQLIIHKHPIPSKKKNEKEEEEKDST
jgi:hypothetical protein